MTAVPSTVQPAVQTIRWPKVLGILLIVLGAFDALTSIGNAVGINASRDIIDSMSKLMIASKGAPSSAESFVSMENWMIAYSVVTTFVVALLIIGGARLMKRRASCRTIILSWAALKILLAITATVFVYFMLRDSMASFEADLGASAEKLPAAIKLLQIASLGLGFLWATTGAIFMIIWFNLREIRAEVSSWL